MLSQNNQKSLVNPNSGDAMPECVVLPKEMQAKIDEYFGYFEGLESMEEDAWDIIASSAYGATNYGFDIETYTQYLFIYRMTFRLIKFLHNYKSANQITVS